MLFRSSHTSEQSQHDYTPEQHATLLRDIKEINLEWMFNNIILPIRKLIEGKLSGGPVELSDDKEIDINQLLDDTERSQPKYHTCELCNEQELKDKMVKCRVCYH